MAAVFGAAARVPIATLLMVTEMTGGYQLLVPAALAVMISYLIQARLARHLKYKSLYEAQVVTRAQSPAHYMDEVRGALALIGRHRLPKKPRVGHLDLLALLQSGIPLDLPHEKRLSMVVLADRSPVVGKSLREICLDVGEDDFEIMAVFRKGEILLPHPDTVLREGDRILVVASPALPEHLRELFTSSRHTPGANE
jgi:chloride channel protein, CIC family